MGNEIKKTSWNFNRKSNYNSDSNFMKYIAELHLRCFEITLYILNISSQFRKRSHNPRECFAFTYKPCTGGFIYYVLNVMTTFQCFHLPGCMYLSLTCPNLPLCCRRACSIIFTFFMGLVFFVCPIPWVLTFTSSI